MVARISWLNRLVDRINDRGRYLFITPCVSVIGNCSEELVFALVRAQRESKKLVVLRPYDLPWRFRFPITNREIFNLTSPHHADVPAPVRVALQLALTVVYGSFHVASRILGKVLGQWAHLGGHLTHPSLGSTALWKPVSEPDEVRWDVIERYNWVEALQKPLRVALKPGKRAEAHATRLAMGIPEGAWFAGLHVRERGFYNSKEEPTCRNATIANYIPAIREITSRGGWVVRLGDKSMTPLPPGLERVIDYPHTPFKSDLMDMYLISECRFYIGMTSGILDTAYLFQRPTLIANMSTTTLAYPRRPGDRGILKHVYSKSKGRFLSLKELFESPWETQHFYTLDDDYEMFENTPEELHEAVVEFLDDLGRDVPATPLQEEANRLRIKSGRELVDRTLTPVHYDDMHNRYRLASRLESSAGSLSRGFLEKNWLKSVRNP